MFCLNCGNTIVENVQFCNRCGKPVRAAAVTRNGKQVQPKYVSIVKKKKNDNLNLKLGLIIGSVASLLLLVIMIALLIPKNEKEDFKQEQNIIVQEKAPMEQEQVPAITNNNTESMVNNNNTTNNNTEFMVNNNNTTNNLNTDNVGIPDVYYKILREIYDALCKEKEMGDWGFVYQYFESDLAYAENIDEILAVFGYCIMDINHDGIEELIISSQGYDTICAMFTMSGSDAVQVIYGYPYETYNLLNNGKIYYNFHINSGLYGMGLYNFQGTELVKIISFSAEELTGKGSPSNFYCHDLNGTAEISKKEFEESRLIESSNQIVIFDCIPFESFK